MHPCEEKCHFFGCKEDKPCTHKIIITCPCQLRKQEMKCNASKDSRGNLDKSLACDDACALAERNRKLALALDIPSDHENDHIPYSADTMSLFNEFPKWATSQERELRVFADSLDEKRLRFKPMPATQRAFLHALAADFGFDSESMDPEPHRHIAIFKTPRFVSAPSKTLRDCIRIRQRANAVPSAAPSNANATSITSPHDTANGQRTIGSQRSLLLTPSVPRALPPPLHRPDPFTMGQDQPTTSGLGRGAFPWPSSLLLLREGKER